MRQERSGMQRNAFESNTEGTTAIRTMAIILIILAAVCFAYAGSSDVKASDQIKHPTGGVILPDEGSKKDKDFCKTSDKTGRLGVSLETVYSDMDAAKNALRTVMKRREEKYVKFRYPLGFDEVFHAAISHTKCGIEGDYLKWHAASRTGNSKEIMVYNYYTTFDQERTMNTKVAQTLSSLNIRSQLTDYDKLTAIYDWICANIEYDYDNPLISHAAYGGMVKKKGGMSGICKFTL